MKKLSLPGPKAKKIMEEDSKLISSSYMRPHDTVIDHGKGVRVWDVDGNEFLDFSAGIAVCSTGHCHPDVVQAIQKQAGVLIHMSNSDFRYESLIRLASKLAEVTPGSPDKRVFFGNSGAEAVEAALKLARFSTGRKLVLAYYGAFHGRTYGAMSLTASKWRQREGFDPLVPGVTHVPYPYCYRCPLNLTHPQCEFACIKYIEKVVFETVAPPSQVAAMFIEPIQGEGGYIVPPPGYLKELKKLLEKHGILFVDDEVQAGMGRTGKMFAIEHSDIVPDIVCIAKGIASGMPIGAIVAGPNIMNWPPGSHASTFGGNPISCEAALATIRLLENEYIENARKIGDYFIEKLTELASVNPFIGDVRGKGLMIACEIVKDKDTKEKAPDEMNAIINECSVRGLLLLGCGQNSVRFIPPLLVNKDEIDLAFDIFVDSLKTIEN
jgi:4-aminobutyrate aminotransferase